MGELSHYFQAHYPPSYVVTRRNEKECPQKLYLYRPFYDFISVLVGRTSTDQIRFQILRLFVQHANSQLS